MHQAVLPPSRADRLDEAALYAVRARAIKDLGAAVAAVLVAVGDRLGLYSAMARLGPTQPRALAETVHLNESYVRAWLGSQTVGGYVEYQPDTGLYWFPAEHLTGLNGGEGVVPLLKGFRLVAAAAGHPVAADSDVVGDLLDCFVGGMYADNLMRYVLAVEGLTATLTDGARVADLGCRSGQAAIALARTFPACRCDGFEADRHAVARARQQARQSGCLDRTAFRAGEVVPGRARYDLVLLLGQLQRSRDAAALVRRARRALTEDGMVLLVEPLPIELGAEDPIGRLQSGLALLTADPHGSDRPAPSIGSTATDAELRELFARAGFRNVKRVTETSFDRVFEVRV